MLRKVMVACVGIAALLFFARFAGSGGASGNAAEGRPAAAVPAFAQIAALPAAAAQAVPASGNGTGNRNRATPAARAESALDLLASFSPAGAVATATAAAAPTARPQRVEPAAVPTNAAPVNAGQAATANNEDTASLRRAQSSATVPEPDAPTTLNGVALNSIVVLPEGTLGHIRQTYALGQVKGRNPRAFSKIGDSTMAFPPLLAVFDNPAAYRLGPYNYLSSTIERFGGSLSRESAAVKKGMHSWSEFDPAWVNSNQCQSGEGPVACELRLNNPSIVFIRLGTNDYNMPDQYREGLLKILDYCLTRGVIPVLGTKPDRLEGPQNTINEIVYQLAADYELPVWDYDLIASTVPGKGLMSDGTHYLNNGSRDYGSKAAFTTADSLEDLSALMMLDALSRSLPQ